MKKLERNLRRPSKNHSSCCTNHPSGIYNNHIQFQAKLLVPLLELAVSLISPERYEERWLVWKLELAGPVASLVPMEVNAISSIGCWEVSLLELMFRVGV
ncbi:hypothetical protein MKW98_024688 [Papaver atlanticum]|uniref:Uncharacterized protein n=1 Tax=Papaver atlanticum TaxID=357466 RepID=A0AAD4S3L3_9MAGN|nr:hypothetical protein MKW98_024688 [Papaver atlanticum]